MTHFKKSYRLIACGEKSQAWYKNQACQSLKNIEEILKKSHASLDTVIKTTCFLTDMSHFPQFNEVYKKFFNGKNPPARSCIAVSGLPKEALVEIEIIAYIP
ncbi:hypothetical protein GR294_07030 [Raoultella sp. Lac2]|uniref:Rid family hydrolase n=1 Tax=unclassified Raoultella TaxID=2627600 RepID=UPI00135343FA|nr:hypothetical protein [Raoultella sp. Lac2]MXF99456.1 hypothetical protein [Raoultella sp. Lac1]